MRIAALYDIHGNVPALEAVLDDARRAGVDGIVVGGDVLPGPMPLEALACLQQAGLPLHCIRGNGETAVLAYRRGNASDISLPEAARVSVKWTAEQLGAGEEEWLGGWPLTIRMEIPPLGKVLFCHATPKNENDIFTRLTSEDRLVPIFAGCDAAIVVCGHTHMQFDRMIGPARVVNAGSVGMPFGAPGADWLLIGPDVELRHTPYDLERAAERIRATAYPDADGFASRHVLHPPSESAMLSAMSAAELG